MDKSEDLSSEDTKNVDSMSAVKIKPKKRSLVERELETNLTARITSPVANVDETSKSRYGRARRLKTDSDFYDTDKAVSTALKSTKYERSPIQIQSPQAYKMHASNSPVRESCKKDMESSLDNQIENIYNANISLSRFAGEQNVILSPAKKFPKVYTRKDLIQTKEKKETITLIKNIFSPVKNTHKSTNSHLSNVLERSSEKYNLNFNDSKPLNGYLDNSSVVKTLDFDGGKKRKENRDVKTVSSRSDMFEIEARCEYQVGDVAWARMGTYPFWPCIVTREPLSNMFVKKKLFGRIERDIIHVTFFGDNGRRSWIVDTMLKKFLGRLEFETTREQFTPEDKKKDPRLYSAFFISEKKQSFWNKSVEEAEMLFREPKRLRIDLLHDLLGQPRLSKVISKHQQAKSEKVTRKDSDVSLSESLYDTLFSEDDGKADDSDRAKNKRNNKSLDVSEVVTACLDNMATKTGITKIQRQSHMDRWLQKAKSKTPEKSQMQVTINVERLEKEDRSKRKAKEKESKLIESKKKKTFSRDIHQKPYSFRKSVNESQNLLSHHNEHDYSNKADDVEKCNVNEKIPQNVPDNNICVIGTVISIEETVDDTNLENIIPTNTKVPNEFIEQSVNDHDDVTVVNETETQKNNVPPDEMEVDLSNLDGIPLVTNACLENNVTENSKQCENFEAYDAIHTKKDVVCVIDNKKEWEDVEVSVKVEPVESEVLKEQVLKNEIKIEVKPSLTDNEMSTDNDITNTESNYTTDKDVGETRKLNLDKNLSVTEISKEVIVIVDSDSTKNNEVSTVNHDVIDVCNKMIDNVCMSEEDPQSDYKIVSSEEKNQNDLFQYAEPIKEIEEETSKDLILVNILNENVENIKNGSIVEMVAIEKVLNDDNVIAVTKENVLAKNITFNKIPDKSLENHLVDDSEDLFPDNGVIDTVDNQPKNDDLSNNNNSSLVPKEIKLTEALLNSHSASEKENGMDLAEEHNLNTQLAIKDESLGSDTESLKSTNSLQSTTEHETIHITNNSTEPVMVNGFHESHNIVKEQLDSETESKGTELDVISLKELRRRSVVDTNEYTVGSVKENILSKQTSLTKNYLGLKVTECRINLIRSKLPLITKISPETNMELKTDPEFVGNEGELISNTKEPIVNGIRDGEDNNTDRNMKDKLDLDVVSINSEDSTVSLTKRRGKKEKQTGSTDQIDRLKNPEFLKYLELKQDALIDEHPELTYEEIVEYLYKTWLYEDSVKSDSIKTDDIEQSNLVKGLNQDLNKKKPNKVRKKLNKFNDISKEHKDIKRDISKEPKKSISDGEIILKEKPKRKIVQPYYNEDFSDIEEEIQLFEIFNEKTKLPKPEDISKSIETTKSIQDSKVSENSELEKDFESGHATEGDIEEIIDGEGMSPEEYDIEELYFEQLTEPKPNIFKGLVREKVCEICECTSNLVKCKGCNGMFHVDCVRKEIQIVETPTPSRGRKKKNKRKGRKPKVSTDSNGVDSESHSDDRSQDANASDELQNMSIEELEPETHIVADVEDFEALFTAKMNEMFETTENIQYDSYSSNDGLDWSDTVAGKCEIVNVELKPKSQPLEIDYSNFKCKNCQRDETPLCFVCKSPVSPKDQSQHRQKCQVAHCHKYYHLKCLDHWPQTQFNSGEPSRSNKKISEFFEALSCPRHVCHTCVCDDPRGCKTRFSGDKLARCVRCPATYHSFTKCLPAGTQILTASHIICPRHYEHRPGKVPCHVNTGWCFICALGGSLICCEYCPTSFHAECLNIDPPDGGYMCEDCETGRLPLYGEMVWVKLGHYRWWPGIVLHPCEIPENIMAVKHSPGEFVVRFFGQYDHYWVNRGRVFPFQEGDSGRVSGQKSKIDEAFTKAMEHAHRAWDILKNAEPNDEESLDIALSLLPPHYVKLKVNKPCGSLCGRRVDVEESSLTQCECDPNEEDACGPYSHCLNRMLLTECGPTCRAGERCNNRAFEKRLYPKLVPYRTPQRGWGLKTLEDIKAGQFVIEYVGELIDEEEFKRRMRRKHEIRDENYYFLTLDKERMIDAGPKGNLARFMNHCCEPNCETQKWTVLGDVRVGLFAINDIPANSEVNFNYNLECAGIEKKRCLCGAKRCSGYIGAKPKQDDAQLKKGKLTIKKSYKKRKNIAESPSTSKDKPKRPVGRPAKPRELTDIEKDLLIIKNATSGLSSDSEGSGRLSSIDTEVVGEKKDAKALKRKRVSFSTEEVIIYDDGTTPSVKRVKLDEQKISTEVCD